MRSIELTLDPQTDAGIRSRWQSIADAGLPSLASHTGDSNRPHITLAAGDRLAGEPVVVSGVPIDIAFGGIVLFPLAKGRFVLALQVVPSRDLLALHAAVHAGLDGGSDQTRPDSWTPHVTLSRRLTAAQVADALPLLGDAPPGQATGARLWDGIEKTVTALTSPPVE